MRVNKWKEVEKEYELTNGEWAEKRRKVKNLTGLNPKTKEIWDIIFKFFAAIAIFTPFLIITLQSRNQLHNERKTELSNLYFGILSDFRNFYITSLNQDFPPEELETKIDATYPAKLAMYGNEKIQFLYDTVRSYLKLKLYTAQLQKDCDRLLYFSNSIDSIRRKAYHFIPLNLMEGNDSNFSVVFNTVDVDLGRCRDVSYAIGYENVVKYSTQLDYEAAGFFFNDLKNKFKLMSMSALTKGVLPKSQFLVATSNLKSIDSIEIHIDKDYFLVDSLFQLKKTFLEGYFKKEFR